MPLPFSGTPLKIVPVALCQLGDFCELLSLSSAIDDQTSRIKAVVAPHQLLAKYRLDDLFFVEKGDVKIAALILSARSDDSWSDATGDDAYYLRQLAVSPGVSCRAIVTEICNCAAQFSAQAGMNYLRIGSELLAIYSVALCKAFGFEELGACQQSKIVSRMQMPLFSAVHHCSSKGIMNTFGRFIRTALP